MTTDELKKQMEMMKCCANCYSVKWNDDDPDACSGRQLEVANSASKVCTKWVFDGIVRKEVK